MARIIGVRNLHIAKVLKDNVGEDNSWDVPYSIPSLISLDITDNTENITFYSDDSVEQVIPSFSGKEVTIELGYLEDEVEAYITGNEYKNGLYRQKANATVSEFAIMFKAPKSKCKEVQNGADADLIQEGAFRYVTLFKGVLSKNEESYQGKQETLESSNVTLTGVFMPLVTNGEVMKKADNDVTFGTNVDVQAGKFDVDITKKDRYVQMIADWFGEVTIGLPRLAPFKVQKTKDVKEKVK